LNAREMVWLVKSGRDKRRRRERQICDTSNTNSTLGRARERKASNKTLYSSDHPISH
jgi:hypothetical protein